MSKVLSAQDDAIKAFWQNIEWAYSHWGILTHTLKDRVKFAYSDDLTLNASIRLEKNQEVSCLVNIGTSLGVYDIFMQMAANAEINGVAASGYLVTPYQHTNERFTDYNWLLTDPNVSSHRLVPQYVPKDVTRMAIGHQLVSLAALFVVLHEEAHYLCGHLDLLDQKRGCPQLFERPSEISMDYDWPNATALRKFMEMEADVVSLSILLEGGRDRNVLHTTKLGRQMNESIWENLVMLVASSMCCAFELAAKRRGASITTSTHPSAGCRWLNLLHVYKNHVQSITGQTPSPVELGLIIDNLSIVAKMIDALPVDISDVLAALYAGVSPQVNSPAEEFIAILKETKDTISSIEWVAARSEALKRVGIELPVSEDLSRTDPHHYDLATSIPLSALDTLRRRSK